MHDEGNATTHILQLVYLIFACNTPESAFYNVGTYGITDREGGLERGALEGMSGGGGILRGEKVQK